MTLPFADSAQSTLGIEWELALVDAVTGDLRPEAPDVIASALEAAGLGPDDDHPHVTAEMLQNTVELVTGVHRTVGDAAEELRGIAEGILDAAERRGMHLYCQGSHPFAEPNLQPVTDHDRYNRVVEIAQYWGRQMLIFGVHVHVGLDDVSKAMPVVNGLVNRFPHFVALSASSPFWAGADTGYESQRTQVFQQLPTAGLPHQFEEYADFEHCIDQMVKVGMVDDATECRWDVRAVPRLGTVEMRACDGMSTIEEIAAVTALTQCLVHDLSTNLERGADAPAILPPWYVQENKWRAARYGMEARVILDPSGTTAPVAEHLAEELDRLAPTARELGCEAELEHVRVMMAQGPAADRQRRIEREAAAALPAESADLSDPVAPLRAVVLDAAGLTRRSVRGRAD
ncbi:glutamate--cysteine ligase [Micrococcus sp.]|uniref:glutamate--cysteine ligase n=1 Tax=Micrococcus sp. TaxID=1271 RepID=UPI002A908BED|nr:glutamate--cysteine ligase [Micrococcus sp.]MDY6055827.1 glutamate--cysteine ligase [Micrococcus sp.]